MTADAASPPSKLGSTGPHGGHIWATNDQTAADNSGHSRAAMRPAQQALSAIAAGRCDPPRIPDTEEIAGSNPVAPTNMPLTSGNAGQFAVRALLPGAVYRMQSVSHA